MHVNQVLWNLISEPSLCCLQGLPLWARRPSTRPSERSWWRCCWRWCGVTHERLLWCPRFAFVNDNLMHDNLTTPVMMGDGLHLTLHDVALIIIGC